MRRSYVVFPQGGGRPSTPFVPVPYDPRNDVLFAGRRQNKIVFGADKVDWSVKSIVRDNVLAVPPSGLSAIKYHPGLYREDGTILRTGTTTPDLLAATLSEPSYVIGFMVNASWQIILSDSQNGFPILLGIYNQLKNAGKRMIISIWPAAIGSNTSFPTSSLPSYLQGATYNPNGGGGYIGTTSGPFAKIWYKVVMDAFIADCLNTLGPVFNSLPFFEGIMLPETAWAQTSPTDSGYSGDDVLVPQFLRLPQIARTQFPNCLITTRWNYTTNANCISLAQSQVPYAIGGGTTDVLSQQTPQDAVWQGSVGGVDYRPILPMTPCSEFPFSGTADQIVSFGLSTYKMNYFIVSHESGWTAGVNDWPAMKTAYVAHGASTITTKPSSYP